LVEKCLLSVNPSPPSLSSLQTATSATAGILPLSARFRQVQSCRHGILLRLVPCTSLQDSARYRAADMTHC
jgi:hypothetical protein